MVDVVTGLAEGLPTGIYHNRGIERYVRDVLSDPDRSNDFRELNADLRITATDLDTCERIVFGEGEWDSVPISRAVAGPNRLTSRVVTFGLPTCSAMPFHIAPMAAFPRTIAAPGGNATASAVYSSAIPAKSPLLNNSIHFALIVSIWAF